MLIEKLFLLHRLLFIPYFNNSLGGGEGREGGYSQWWPLRPILPQKGCNEKVGILLPEEYERLQGILSFRSVLWPKSATKGFKSRANFSVLWYVYSWRKCIYSSLKREWQSSKLNVKWVPFINERYTGVGGGGCLPEESFVKYLSPGLYHASRGFFPVLSVTQLVCLRTWANYVTDRQSVRLCNAKHRARKKPLLARFPGILE